MRDLHALLERGVQRTSLDTYTSTPTEPPRRPTTPVTATPAEYDGSPSIAPPVRPVASPTFQQVPPATAAPTPAPHNYGPPPHEPLDHSFIGLTGGEIFHEMMLRHDHFDFVLPRHEQGAGHMAEGYARVSGKPGVVLVTSGPGATNVVATSAISSDAFQEADIVGISRSCTKWNIIVKDIAELPRRINEAFKIATSGRPVPCSSTCPRM
ncbi:thiamine diphosphate-binding protein [Mycena belliarum]|uniref:Thiamine diphosphate-binding protein n=1 Tax=Mycena belliarum TaxID=1033014 RepID=A0AAD6XPF1_9AGAR|nr:thiamine diphosphate-binding protein [Mycena belliae]